VTLTDSAAGVTIGAGRGCVADGATVTCSRISSLKLALGDGDNISDSASVAFPTAVTAGSGADRIVTGGAFDSLISSDGVDWLDGGAGSDTFNAGGGDDVVLARDGAIDGITCGTGADSGTDDDKDYTASDCEGLGEVPPSDPGDPGDGGGDPVPGGDPGNDPADPTNPADPADPADPTAGDPRSDPDREPGADSGPDSVGGGLTGPLNLEPPVLLAQTAPVRNGVAAIAIECPVDAGRCEGTVEIFLPGGGGAKAKAVGVLAKRARRRTLRIGRAKFSARAGTKPVVKVRLNRRGRRRVTRRRRVRARVVVTTRTQSGEVITTRRTITLAARRAAGRGKGRR
jgi:hypothetical protein